jgi:hypothetical protein
VSQDVLLSLEHPHEVEPARAAKGHAIGKTALTTNLVGFDQKKISSSQVEGKFSTRSANEWLKEPSLFMMCSSWRRSPTSGPSG